MRISLFEQSWRAYCTQRERVACSAFIFHRNASTRTLDLQAIDEKWQPFWQDRNNWASSPSPKGKYYVLPMFPYPSGNLHIGHVRVYTISDVIARYRRMCGFRVLHPMGWDAFGLPAENAAIERGISPATWTMNNISKMKDQIQSMGGCWDWDKEFMTCDTTYYKDTQRKFLMLFRRGLAYQAEAEVNYDPIDMTVLANEQVDSNGISWRSGAKVEKKMLRQWFLRITDYKEALREDLLALEGDHVQSPWPLRVTAQQRNWLGRSQGSDVTFRIQHQDTSDQEDSVTVYTTRPDTLFGVQYLALSLEHPLVLRHAERDPALRIFLESAKHEPAWSKVGYLLPGVQGYNPVAAIADPSSAVATPLPVFVAPYVLAKYGAGAIMGVPAHDGRDNEFWKLNGPSSDLTYVVEPDSHPSPTAKRDTVISARGVLNANCGTFGGMSSHEGGRAIVNALLSRDGSAQHVEKWRLRDWLISRQRYWGTPIPVVHCQSCGPVAVPEEQLPVELPPLAENQLAGKGGNPLEHIQDWVHTSCPKCGGPARRETDTMDTFMDSSWYYLRFARSAQHQEKMNFMPVDVYVGGVEHAILHLLYARFVAKFLSTTDFWPSGYIAPLVEPFSTLISQGMVHGKTFSDPTTGRFLKPDEVDTSNVSAPTIRADGQRPLVTFEKMSKSKYNGVDPAECLRKFGADVTRAHLLFSAPVSEVLEWDEEKITGVQRWFARVWQIVHDLSHTTGVEEGLHRKARLPSGYQLQHTTEADLWQSVQKSINSVTEAYSTTYSLNTVVSDLMQLTNSISSALNDKTFDSAASPLLYPACNILLRLVAPIAPSFAEESWEILHWGQAKVRAFEAGFPVPDGTVEALQARSFLCSVQVNGKRKFQTQLETPPKGLDSNALRNWVLRRAFESVEASQAMKKGTWSLGDAKRVIVAKGGKLVNLVITEKPPSNQPDGKGM